MDKVGQYDGQKDHESCESLHSFFERHFLFHDELQAVKEMIRQSIFLITNLGNSYVKYCFAETARPAGDWIIVHVTSRG